MKRLLSLAALLAAAALPAAETSALWKQYCAERAAGKETFLPDFSYAGYGMGEKSISPAVETIFNVRDYGAVPDDDGDDMAAIQKAIDATLGCKVDVPTVYGDVSLSIPAGTQHGTKFRLKGKGIPGLNGRGRGDQYVTVNIETPRNLNREQKEALRKFSELLGEKNYEEHKGFFGKFKL